MSVVRVIAAVVGSAVVAYAGWSVIGTLIVPRRIHTPLIRVVAIGVRALFRVLAHRLKSYEARGRPVPSAAYRWRRPRPRRIQKRTPLGTTMLAGGKNHERRLPTGRSHSVAEGPVGHRLAQELLRRASHRAYDIEVEGLDQVPAGPTILAANHRSFMDSIFLAAAVNRPVSFIAKAEYFENRASAWILRSLGQIPLRRGSPASARAALAAGLSVLSRGGAVGVYPEGTRSRDGRLHRGHLGPARLAVGSSAPIVPVGLVGSHDVQGPHHRLPRLGKRVIVRFGSALLADPAVDNGRAQLRDLTDQVMAEIAGLCGQEYVEDYAPLASV